MDTFEGFSPSSLEGFAREKIRADLYPTDHHPFRLFPCSRCGLGPFSVVVTHHERSSPGDFMGIVTGTCKDCGRSEDLFGCTGGSEKVVQVDQPECECGCRWFWVAILERYEGEDGLPGFFDEGVIAGQCDRCGANRTFVFTD